MHNNQLEIFSSDDEDIYFEEVTEENSIVNVSYFRRGRCNSFFSEAVGKKSTCGCCHIVKNKDHELKRCVKSFTGKKFNIDDWDVINPKMINNSLVNFQFDLEEGQSMERCFCTQTIKKLRYAIYKPTMETCLVGSECIGKFLGKDMKKKANGDVCKMCHQHLDRRKPFHKEHDCCSDECLKSFTLFAYRKCTLCNQLSILKTKPDNILYCDNCTYKINNFCECIKCGELSILKKDQRNGIIYCDKCLNRINNYRVCSKCNEYEIHISEESWKKICKSCAYTPAHA